MSQLSQYSIWLVGSVHPLWPGRTRGQGWGRVRCAALLSKRGCSDALEADLADRVVVVLGRGTSRLCHRPTAPAVRPSVRSRSSYPPDAWIAAAREALLRAPSISLIHRSWGKYSALHGTAVLTGEYSE
jgi:hypothetical protein